MRYEFLFALHKLVKVGVKGAFRDIAVNVHFFIFVALTDNASLALLEIRRTPRTIQMVQSDELLLTVRSRAHTLGTAQQDTHLTVSHLSKQVFLLHLALGVMNESNLIFGNTQLDQFRPNILINILERSHAEAAVFLLHHLNRPLLAGSGQIAENHLCGALICGALPNLEYIFRTLGSFAIGVARQHRIDKPLVQRQLAPIVGDEQHIIHSAVHLAVADFLGALCQRRHNLLLILRGLQGDIVVMCLRHGELEHIRCLNIRHIFEKAHQLRQVVKFSKARLGTVAGSLRGQLDSGDGFPVVGRPAIEVL